MGTRWRTANHAKYASGEKEGGDPQRRGKRSVRLIMVRLMGWGVERNLTTEIAKLAGRSKAVEPRTMRNTRAGKRKGVIRRGEGKYHVRLIMVRLMGWRGGKKFERRDREARREEQGN
jgi:hypothetical protein